MHIVEQQQIGIYKILPAWNFRRLDNLVEPICTNEFDTPSGFEPLHLGFQGGK